MEIEEKIERIINSNTKGIPRDYKGENLFEIGVLDSLSVMQMVAELDDTFNIDLDVDDIVAGNFESIDAIASLVKKYL